MTDEADEKLTREYRDTLGKTLKKVPWSRFIADASLELVPRGIGFGVALTGAGVLGEPVVSATERVLEFTLRKFSRVYEAGEVALSEVLGREIPDMRYGSVSEFWAHEERDHLEHDALVEITGLISPYGPLMPAHPMSRPGYTIEGWQKIGNLETKSTEEYDSRDGFIYGDRVIRLATPRQGKYFGGLYDPYFGLSNVGIPLWIDKSASAEIQERWKVPMVAGLLATLKGRLKKIPNFYAQFAGQLPGRYCNLPSFGLEVFKIDRIFEPDGITHMAVSVSWDRRSERMVTHYFNVQDQDQFRVVEELLDQTRDQHKTSLLFNYDDFSCLSPEWRRKLPEYNEMLRPWLDGGQLD